MQQRIKRKKDAQEASPFPTKRRYKPYISFFMTIIHKSFFTDVWGTVKTKFKKKKRGVGGAGVSQVIWS